MISKALALDYYFFMFVCITIFSLKILCQKDFCVDFFLAPLVVGFIFQLFQLFIVWFEKRSATPCKRSLLIFNFTAIDDEIQDFQNLLFFFIGVFSAHRGVVFGYLKRS